MLPKLIITDIDGVWTDGGMYYDQTGNEWKKFNTSDSAGVLFLRLLSIPVAIITGENTTIVANRAKKLGIEELHQGVHNKLKVAQEICKRMQIGLHETAYIGDDIGDIPLLRNTGLSGCPANAPDYIQKIVHTVTKNRGGEGAFREFVECILQKENMFEKVLSNFEEGTLTRNSKQ
ncbi:MAG: HAD hydrolase family protein [Crocinitomicaceae bacterium]|nr:HAD hydrolase family protein [Crocinitomicaceae bacterium]